MAARRTLILLLCALFAPLSAAIADPIKSIEIEGLRYSKERLVLREMPFAVGDDWRPEYAAIGERRLRNLGLFSEARISPPDHDGVVHIYARDRWPLWILPEATRSDGGASSAGVALTHHNLWGLHHHLRLAARADTGKNFSTNNGNSYQASYIWRRINDSNVGLDMSANRGTSVFDAYQNGIFTSQYLKDNASWSVGALYALGPVPGEGLDLRIGFAWNHDSYTLTDGPALPDVQGQRRHAITFNATYQLIDDQITWLTGSRFAYSLEVAHRSLGSTINVYRQSAIWLRYIDLGEQRVLACRLAGGLATGNVLRDGLFDVGGGNAIRGYYPGEVQGSGYIYGTLEGRMPLPAYDNVQLVGFVDTGHVSRDGKGVLGKSVIAGAGGGVRWTLRWLVNGTLRADAAYGFATHRWRLHFGTNQAF